MPSMPSTDGGGEGKHEIMSGVRRVIEYSGLNFYEVLNLPTDTYLLMLKNHYLDELNSTEAGREYLEKCERLNTTQPDREKLMAMKKRGGNNG